MCIFLHCFRKIILAFDEDDQRRTVILLLLALQRESFRDSGSDKEGKDEHSTQLQRVIVMACFVLCFCSICYLEKKSVSQCITLNDIMELSRVYLSSLD